MFIFSCRLFSHLLNHKLITAIHSNGNKTFVHTHNYAYCTMFHVHYISAAFSVLPVLISLSHSSTVLNILLLSYIIFNLPSHGSTHLHRHTYRQMSLFKLTLIIARNTILMEYLFIYYIYITLHNIHIHKHTSHRCLA